METTGSSSKLCVQSNDSTGDKGHTVVSNDDLLNEILLRLPVCSIHLFSFASKRWLSLITSPNFIIRRSQVPYIDPPSGLYISRPESKSSELEYDFVSFDIRIPSKRSTSFPFGPKAHVEILHSCNGLFLCCIRGRPAKFYVYNPSTNLFKVLPQHHNSQKISIVYMRLSFDPTKSLHYKVVCAEYINDDDVHYCFKIQTYSSDTGNWSICADRFDIESLREFRDGTYWNGAIHWLNSRDGSMHYKLDIVEHPTLTTVQTPVSLDGKVNCHCRLFESCGCFFLLRSFYTCSQEFTIYEMRTEYSGWSMKYLINLDESIMLFPNTLKMRAGCICCNLSGIVFGKKEEDSFIVMELYGKVVQYNFVLETINTLCDIGSGSPSRSFQFIASFAHV